MSIKNKLKILPKSREKIHINKKIDKSLINKHEDVILEKFKDIHGTHGKCNQYNDMAVCMFMTMTLMFPTLMASLSGLFVKRFKKEYFYACILGLVQYGKTLPIHLIIWYEKFVNRRNVIFMTANRSSAREGYIDDTSKFNKYIDLSLKKYLNENWNQWWIDQFDKHQINYDLVHAVLLKHFSITGQNFKEYKHTNYIDGNFPVYLQEKKNLIEIAKLYKKTIKSDSGLAIVIDEVHKMYTASWKDRQIDGLTDTLINNNNFMKLFKKKAIENKLALYGITATPCRVMNDPHIAITDKFIIKSDGHKGYFYHGSIHDPISTKHIIKNYNIETIIDCVGDMINRNNTTPLIINGKLVIPLMIISTVKEKLQHKLIVDKIKHQFKDNVTVTEINEDTQSSAQFLDNCRLDKPIILVGRQCFDMAVKIKPSNHTRETTTHLLCGITDHIYKKGSCGESILQSMRSFGYFPEGFKNHYYTTQKTFDVMIAAHNQNNSIITQYDKNLGYKSIINLDYSGVQLHPTPVKNDPYMNITQNVYTEPSHNVYDYDPTYECIKKGKINKISTLHHILDISKIDLNDSIITKNKLFNSAKYLKENYHKYNCLNDLYGGYKKVNIDNSLTNDQKITRIANREKLIFKKNLNMFITGYYNPHKSKRTQIAYNDQRTRDIDIGVCFPKDKTDWQINVSVGPDTSTFTKLPITIYKEEYQTREKTCVNDVYNIYQRADNKWIVCYRNARTIMSMGELKLSKSTIEEKCINEILSEITDEKQKSRFNKAQSLLNKNNLKNGKKISFNITQNDLSSYLKNPSGRKNEEIFKNVVDHYQSLKHLRDKYQGLNVSILASLLTYTNYPIT